MHIKALHHIKSELTAAATYAAESVLIEKPEEVKDFVQRYSPELGLSVERIQEHLAIIEAKLTDQ